MFVIKLSKFVILFKNQFKPRQFIALPKTHISIKHLSLNSLHLLNLYYLFTLYISTTHISPISTSYISPYTTHTSPTLDNIISIKITFLSNSKNPISLKCISQSQMPSIQFTKYCCILLLLSTGVQMPSIQFTEYCCILVQMPGIQFTVPWPFKHLQKV